MGKVNVTISQEALHDIMSEFSRDNSWAILQSICSSVMKNGDWNIEVTSPTGDDKKIKTPEELIEHLKKGHSRKARKKLIQNFSARKNTKK